MIPANSMKNQNRYEKPTGVFFYEQTSKSLKDSIKFFEQNLRIFEKQEIRKHALKFDRKVFKDEIAKYVEEKYKEFQDRTERKEF